MSVIESVIENVVVGEVEKIVKPKVAKLQVKYERLYMSLFTVLNSFCIPAETEGDFVLKKEEMRKILDAVDFYSDDVSLQSMFMEENILSKDNVKSVRKLMKEERYEWKVDNGLVEKKKKRGGKSTKGEEVVEKKVSKKKIVESETETDTEKVIEKVSVIEVIEEVVEKIVKGKVKKDKVKKGEEKKDVNLNLVVDLEEKKKEKKKEKTMTPKMEEEHETKIEQQTKIEHETKIEQQTKIEHETKMEEEHEHEHEPEPKIEQQDIPKKKHVKKPKKHTELVTDLPFTLDK
jgi:hypothetical protein